MLFLLWLLLLLLLLLLLFMLLLLLEHCYYITIIVMIIVFLATIIIILLCTRPTCRTTQWAGPSVFHRKPACERRGAPAVLAMSFTSKQRPTEFDAARTEKGSAHVGVIAGVGVSR